MNKINCLSIKGGQLAAIDRMNKDWQAGNTDTEIRSKAKNHVFGSNGPHRAFASFPLESLHIWYFECTSGRTGYPNITI